MPIPSGATNSEDICITVDVKSCLGFFFLMELTRMFVDFFFNV